MFETTLNPLWDSFIRAVQEEVKPALGCTEPISLALAAAVASSELDGAVERIDAWVSPNLMKNGMGVTVPGTGMVGLPVAAALGVLGKCPCRFRGTERCVATSDRRCESDAERWQGCGDAAGALRGYPLFPREGLQR